MSPIPSNRPNIIVIMADELRDDIVRHTLGVRVPLPHLDRLREGGVTLANCFCQTPTCCPSRGSFSTGKYPHQLGLWNHLDALPPEERTMGHHFAARGYDAVAIGKTHNMCPGFRSITYDHTTAFAANHGYTVTDEDCVGVFDGPEEAFGDFIACRQFDEFLAARSGDQPFLAHVGIYSPHPPLYPPRRFAEQFDWREIVLPFVPESEAASKPKKQAVPRGRWEALSDASRKKVIATVLGMSVLVDECVGRIVESLKAHDCWKNTIVVFTSDHGDLMGAHGMLGKFFNHYEEALRVPMILRLPGDAHAGTLRSELTEMLDIYPTLCELAGVPLPDAAHTLPGRSLVPLLHGDTTDTRKFVFSQIEHAYMIRSEDWKLVVHTEDISELYHLATDPGEHQNLFGRPEWQAVERDLLLHLVQVLGTHRRQGFHCGKNGFFG